MPTYDIKDISHIKPTLWECFLLLFKRKKYSSYAGLKGTKSGRMVYKTLRGKVFILSIQE